MAKRRHGLGWIDAHHVAGYEIHEEDAAQLLRHAVTDARDKMCVRAFQNLLEAAKVIGAAKAHHRSWDPLGSTPLPVRMLRLERALWITLNRVRACDALGGKIRESRGKERFLPYKPYKPYNRYNR